MCRDTFDAYSREISIRIMINFNRIHLVPEYKSNTAHIP